MSAVRLTYEEKQIIRAEIAAARGAWMPGLTAYNLAARLSKPGRVPSLFLWTEFLSEVLKYHGWLVKNRNRVRAQQVE